MRNVHSGSICSSVTFSLGRSFYVTSPTWLSSRCRGFLPGSIFGESNGRIRCWLAGLPFPWVVLSDCRWRYFRLPSSGNPQSAGACEQIPSSRSSAIGGRRFTVQRNIISRVPSFFQVLWERLSLDSIRECLSLCPCWREQEIRGLAWRLPATKGFVQQVLSEQLVISWSGRRANCLFQLRSRERYVYSSDPLRSDLSLRKNPFYLDIYFPVVSWLHLVWNWQPIYPFPFWRSSSA